MKFLRIIILILTLLSLLSCSKKTKTVYISTPCPILRAWETNSTLPKLKIDYKRVKNGYFLEKNEFYSWANFSKELKKRLMESLELIKLYKLEIEEYNSRFAKDKNENK